MRAAICAEVSRGNPVDVSQGLRGVNCGAERDNCDRVVDEVGSDVGRDVGAASGEGAAGDVKS
jgi:hypothetical protein